jgi:hypothetical protein
VNGKGSTPACFARGTPALLQQFVNAAVRALERAGHN